MSRFRLDTEKERSDMRRQVTHMIDTSIEYIAQSVMLAVWDEPCIEDPEAGTIMPRKARAAGLLAIEKIIDSGIYLHDASDLIIDKFTAQAAVIALREFLQNADVDYNWDAFTEALEVLELVLEEKEMERRD